MSTMSSAYRELVTSLPSILNPPSKPSSTRRISNSRMMLKTCLTPLSTVNHSLVPFAVRTWDFWFSYSDRVNDTSTSTAYKVGLGLGQHLKSFHRLCCSFIKQTGDYVEDCIRRSVRWGFCPTRWNVTPFLSCLFFSITRTDRTAGPIFTLYDSNDVFPRKQVPFEVGGSVTSFCGNMPPKTPKSGRE